MLSDKQKNEIMAHYGFTLRTNRKDKVVYTETSRMIDIEFTLRDYSDDINFTLRAINAISKSIADDRLADFKRKIKSLFFTL